MLCYTAHLANQRKIQREAHALTHILLGKPGAGPGAGQHNLD
jgi:hypothetical protein